jgi:aminopeptidase YwaD
MRFYTYIIRSISCFVIMCLLSSMIFDAVFASTIQQSLSVEQTHTNDVSQVSPSPDILQMIQKVNESILRTYIQKIQDFGPHPTGSKACDEVSKYLYDTFSSFQLSVRYDPWKDKLRIGTNIESTLPGRNNDTGIVLISAHYDTVTISPGANDDGSGVAAVLAVAEIMSQYCFNSTTRFVLFSGEEQGLLGSHRYVQNAYRHGQRIIADLTLDGVGYAVTSDDGSKIKHHSNNQSAWMVDISKTIASLYYDEIGLEVVKLPHVTFSDHESFVKYNYDASFFYQYVLSPYYHTSEDTLEHMNITYLTKVCRLAVGTLASIAELHPRLSNSDIKISILGQPRVYPCQFIVSVENENSRIDSVNATINIAMKNLRTGQYVLMIKDFHNITCNWTFTEEIQTFWEFKTEGRKYSSQFLALEVTVKGIKDDVTLYKTQRSIGVIVGWSVFLFPK